MAAAAQSRTALYLCASTGHPTAITNQGTHAIAGSDGRESTRASTTTRQPNDTGADRSRLGVQRPKQRGGAGHSVVKLCHRRRLVVPPADGGGQQAGGRGPRRTLGRPREEARRRHLRARRPSTGRAGQHVIQGARPSVAQGTAAGLQTPAFLPLLPRLAPRTRPHHTLIESKEASTCSAPDQTGTSSASPTPPLAAPAQPSSVLSESSERSPADAPDRERSAKCVSDTTTPTIPSGSLAVTPSRARPLSIAVEATPSV